MAKKGLIKFNNEKPYFIPFTTQKNENGENVLNENGELIFIEDKKNAVEVKLKDAQLEFIKKNPDVQVGMTQYETEDGTLSDPAILVPKKASDDVLKANYRINAVKNEDGSVKWAAVAVCTPGFYDKKEFDKETNTLKSSSLLDYMKKNPNARIHARAFLVVKEGNDKQMIQLPYQFSSYSPNMKDENNKPFSPEDIYNKKIGGFNGNLIKKLKEAGTLPQELSKDNDVYVSIVYCGEENIFFSKDMIEKYPDSIIEASEKKGYRSGIVCVGSYNKNKQIQMFPKFDSSSFSPINVYAKKPTEEQIKKYHLDKFEALMEQDQAERFPDSKINKQKSYEEQTSIQQADANTPLSPEFDDPFEMPFPDEIPANEAQNDSLNSNLKQMNF